MDSRIAEILFLVMFSLFLGFSITNVLKAIFPYGVGHVIKEGLAAFFIRAAFIGVMFCLVATVLVLGLRFCGTVEPSQFVGDILNVLVLMMMAMAAWLCDHVTRILFIPIQKKVNIREKEFKYVDIIFVVIYLGIIGSLLLARLMWKQFAL